MLVDLPVLNLSILTVMGTRISSLEIAAEKLCSKEISERQNPDFSESVELNPFGLKDIGSFANLAFADIDHDQDFDLFIGNHKGIVKFFENTGNAEDPFFEQKRGRYPFGLTIEGTYASPSFADYDFDGDLDVFIGYDEAGIAYLKTQGQSQRPTLKKEIMV